ncbi:hypothetical protein, partial [Klebsiella sp. 72125]|uniref:hypothetical protein n=1 Tax=Klebsiella sp. 72125 TaxID=3079067 RepID=UPI003004FBE7
HHGDAENLKIDKYRPGAPFLMAGDSIQHALFAIFGEFYRFLMPHPCPIHVPAIKQDYHHSSYR